MGRSISKYDVIELIVKAGGKCSICKKNLFVDFEKSGFKNLSEMAHIIPYKNSNHRAVKNKKPDNTYANLILLCRYDHKVIDAASEDYPRERLLEIKKEHEDSVRSDKLINSPTGIELSLFSGMSHHMKQDKFILRKLKDFLSGNYGYFNIDLFATNFSKRKYKKVTIEIFPNKMPENLFFSTTPITARETSFNSSVSFTIKNMNYGENIEKNDLFFLCYWGISSLNEMKQLFNSVKFDYYMTADDSNPRRGKLKIINLEEMLSFID